MKNKVNVNQLTEFTETNDYTYCVKLMRKLLVILSFIGSVYGQACCSAGTPFIGSIETTYPGYNWLSIDLMYNYNTLDDLYNESKKLTGNNRNRLSQSVLLQLNYGLSSKLSVSTLFPFIKQNRVISKRNGSKDETKTSGIGDVLAMIKYNLIDFDLFNKNELIAGVGLKLPVGNSQLKSNNILLPADLQPGSGSYDLLLSLYGSKKYIFEWPIHSFINVSFKINGKNSRFGENHEGYKFGNEIIASLGFIYELNDFISIGLESKYRHTDRDEFLGQSIENTGGSWLYIKPALNINIVSDLLAKISSELPVYRKLDGIQLTTSYLISSQLQYMFSFN